MGTLAIQRSYRGRWGYLTVATVALGVVIAAGCSGGGSDPASTPPSTISGVNNQTPTSAPPPSTDPTGTHEQVVVIKSVIPPAVKAMNPTPDSVGASPSTEIALVFTAPMNTQTITTNTVQVSDSTGEAVPGPLSYDTTTNTVTLQPSLPLLDGEIYTVTVTTAVEDTNGITMQDNYAKTFQVKNLKTTQIAVGFSSAYALKENGTVWAWGRNQWGQLGDGSQKDRNRPVHLRDLSNITAIAAGQFYAMALKEDGTVWAWGRNDRGQLGSATPEFATQPQQVAELVHVTAIAAGTTFALALKDNGTVWAWGNNSFGQLGNDSSSAFRPNPEQVTALSNVQKIFAGGNSAYAMVTSDPNSPMAPQVYAWGWNFAGQLGNGNTTNQKTPVPVLDSSKNNLSNIVTLAPGQFHTLALTTDGTVLAWGDNRFAQIAAGASDHITLPTPLLTGATSIGAGPVSWSSFAIKTDGSIWGWGYNRHRQLMILTQGDTQPQPLQLGTITNVDAVMASNDNTYILKKNGAIMAAGFNINGQLGNGSASFYSYKPNELVNTPAGIQVSGRSITTSRKTAWLWGSNHDCEAGISGIGNMVMVPVQINLKNVTAISRGVHHVMALVKDATGVTSVWAWGRNSHGELGNGKLDLSCVPVQVLAPNGVDPLNNVTDIMAGWNTSFALQKNPDGTTTVLSWGQNSLGELGLGSIDDNLNKTTHSLPAAVTIAGLSGKVVSLGALSHAMAITDQGQLYAWGWNRSGQVGNGTKINQPTPVLIALPKKVTGTAQGLDHTLAVLEDGTIMAWGSNATGQLGDGTTTSSLKPIAIAGISAVVAVTASNNSSGAVTQDKTLWTWGDNVYGQLALQDSVEMHVPTHVPDPSGTGYFGDILQMSGISNAIKTDGSIWDWGYTDTGYDFIIREGETAFSAFPVTVNWP